MQLELMNNWSYGIESQTCPNEARIDKGGGWLLIVVITLKL
jgi:hypothetical protein